MLRRFDPRCELSLIRNGEPNRRVWIVTIRPLGVNLYEYAQGKAPRLADAIEIAVLEGERKGWAR